ncbi:hypothetical protein MKW98_032111, partial [Papaver atlanticum]
MMLSRAYTIKVFIVVAREVAHKWFGILLQWNGVHTARFFNFPDPLGEITQRYKLVLEIIPFG